MTHLDDILISHRWPQLRILRLCRAYCAPNIATEFLCMHPTIEELSVDDCFGADPDQDYELPAELEFPNEVLPSLKNLHCWFQHFSAIKPLWILPPCVLEQLSGIVLFNNEQEGIFMGILSDISTLRRLEVCKNGAHNASFIHALSLVAPFLKCLVLHE